MYGNYKDCIEAYLKCASACNHCSASCTRENNVKIMARCIELDVECAIMCYTTAQLMSMSSVYATELCKICADICNACAEECGRHDNDHCRQCAAACRQCAVECAAMYN